MAKKKQTLPQPIHTDVCPAPKGIIIAIGGSENKGETPEIDSNQENNDNFEQYAILRRFVEEVKGKDSLILIIPTASGEPEQSSKDYLKVFKELQLSNVEVADIRNREDAAKPEMLDLIQKAKGIMFTGGDQLRLKAILGGTQFLDILKDRFTFEHIVIAGTSAGAMALSTPMIFEGGANNGGFLKGEIHVTTGLEFAKDVAIDTHFIARGRIVRMAQMISMNPGAIGIGLEEDTAVVITNGKDLEVIGSGVITIIDGHTISYTDIHEIENCKPVTICDLRVHFLGKGKTYSLNTRDQKHR